MRIDSPNSSNASITGSFSGSFIGDGAGLTGVPAGAGTISSSAQIADDISGSLGANATLIRTLTATSISGSSTSLSSSIASDIATNTSNIATNASNFAGLDSDLSTFSVPANTTISTFGATLVDDADAAAAKTTLGLQNVTNESKATMFSSPTFTGTVSGVTATHVGLGNVTNESKATMFTNAALTGTPTAPTAATSTDSTQIATTAFVQDRLEEVIAAAPAALDTLNELAAAIGDDADFAGTVTTGLSEKLAKASNLSDLSNAGTARTNLGLGNVENTALSTYTGNGGALDNQYITNGAGYITSAGSISGNAATATKLATARNIAGVSFDGSANISLNNNAITNGAGYTTYSANQGLDNNDNVHFEGLMVGQTSGATANTIRCIGDVVAYYSSDKQFKDNIVTLEGALDKVKAIRGVRFDWNDKQDVYEGHDIGVVAQEVEAVLPELVHYREHSDSKAVDYVKLTAVLIEAVKELSAKVDELSK